AVLAGGSLPLDLGQQRRLFTENQRLALATLYDTCAIDGCDRPFAWSEIHHLTPFAAGGPTDLSNAVPACAFHHHKLDDPAYEHTVLTDAHGRHTITLRRRT
ncbi:MAG: HNH endonuclease, partial [Kineosporiaceae bacterium]|nr:HNH endonuclease [Kineosporiaceae bacterium]